MSRMLKVFLSYDPAQPSQTWTLAQAVAQHASRPVAIIPVVEAQLRGQKLFLREGHPDLLRFLIPHLCEYGDYALFLDRTLTCQGDVYDLIDHARKDDLRAVWCPQQKGQGRTDWSTALLFRNKFCEALTPTVVNLTAPIDLHLLKWAGVDINIGTFPVAWNWLAEGTDAKAGQKLRPAVKGAYATV